MNEWGWEMNEEDEVMIKEGGKMNWE